MRKDGVRSIDPLPVNYALRVEDNLRFQITACKVLSKECSRGECAVCRRHGNICAEQHAFYSISLQLLVRARVIRPSTKTPVPYLKADLRASLTANRKQCERGSDGQECKNWWFHTNDADAQRQSSPTAAGTRGWLRIQRPMNWPTRTLNAGRRFVWSDLVRPWLVMGAPGRRWQWREARRTEFQAVQLHLRLGSIHADVLPQSCR